MTLVDRGSARRGLYLARALAVGEVPQFETVTRQAEAISDDDLRHNAVVVLNDVAVPAALARRLERSSNRAAGCWWPPAQRASWPADVDVLPGTIGNPVDRTRGRRPRGSPRSSSAIRCSSRSARRAAAISRPCRVYGYRSVTAAPDAQVLAKFDGIAPAVLERRVGSGRVCPVGVDARQRRGPTCR